VSDQRALLDECTNRPTCTAEMHLAGCPASPTVGLLAALQRSVDRARADRCEREPNELTDRAAEAIIGQAEADRELRAPAPPCMECGPGYRIGDEGCRHTARERQTWEKRLGDTDVAEKRMHLEVDDQGRVRIHEALVVQLLVDAGWERTA